MQAIIEQFINQIEGDQTFSTNTRAAYKSDLNELRSYIISTNTEVQDINQSWVKGYLKHLEDTNKERNSYNRRASTFRIFLRFLYKQKLAPTNYSLIVNNQTTFSKIQRYELSTSDIKKIIEESKLKIDHKLILLLISKIGLTATQITSLNTFQVDFENKAIILSDTEKIELPHEIFIILREYLINVRSKLPFASKHLNLFLNEKGKPLQEINIYKLIKKLREDLTLGDKLTTRNLKKLSLSENSIDILSMQREILNVIAIN